MNLVQQLVIGDETIQYRLKTDCNLFSFVENSKKHFPLKLIWSLYENSAEFSVEFP